MSQKRVGRSCTLVNICFLGCLLGCFVPSENALIFAFPVLIHFKFFFYGVVTYNNIVLFVAAKKWLLTSCPLIGSNARMLFFLALYPTLSTAHLNNSFSLFLMVLFGLNRKKFLCLYNYKYPLLRLCASCL